MKNQEQLHRLSQFFSSNNDRDRYDYIIIINDNKNIIIINNNCYQ
jgi:hypothetical protein